MESINEPRGLNLGYLVPESGPHVKYWSTEQGGPESGMQVVLDLGQHLACSGVLRLSRSTQACTAINPGYLVTAQF
jgi:hypothetical protein